MQTSVKPAQTGKFVEELAVIVIEPKVQTRHPPPLPFQTSYCRVTLQDKEFVRT